MTIRHKPNKITHRSMDFDKLIHEPARLKIISQLYVVDRADFVFIMNQTGLTQGNISGHLSKLEKEKYVAIKKAFSGKRPITIISLTEKGRTAFDAYISNMRLFLDGIDK